MEGANSKPWPVLRMMKKTVEIANELIIATTSHHALTRHQNQRRM